MFLETGRLLSGQKSSTLVYWWASFFPGFYSLVPLVDYTASKILSLRILVMHFYSWFYLFFMDSSSILPFVPFMLDISLGMQNSLFGLVLRRYTTKSWRQDLSQGSQVESRMCWTTEENPHSKSGNDKEQTMIYHMKTKILYILFLIKHAC